MSLFHTEERRAKPFDFDGAKFSTQKAVTYILVGLFCYVSVLILSVPGTDQSERSMILQTVINLALLATGYWLGSSKQAADRPVASTEPPVGELEYFKSQPKGESDGKS